MLSLIEGKKKKKKKKTCLFKLLLRHCCRKIRLRLSSTHLGVRHLLPKRNKWLSTPLKIPILLGGDKNLGTSSNQSPPATIPLAISNVVAEDIIVHIILLP